MKKTTKQNILVIGSIVLIATLLFVLAFFADYIPMNPDGTVGNTAGNLNNSGLFCEYDGTVYFSNTADHGSLYAMNPDESNVRKLNSLNVRNILAGGDFLYYFQLGDYSDASFGNIISTESFNRCKLNGSDAVGLTRDIVVQAQLVNNYLYLLTSTTAGPSFYKMKIDKSDIVNLGATLINPACAENGIIYYNGTENNHYLYGLDTATDHSFEVWEGNLWYPLLDGDYIYYMDVANNYRICRYSMSQNVVEVLINDRVDCFNVGNGYIYYQKSGDTPQLICMRTDGTDVQVIAEGIFTNINMTSQYVYFQDYDDKESFYHSYIGSGYYDIFSVVE